jgi:sulfide:quinone oxidoreductase
MIFKEVAPGFYVYGQMTRDDVAEAAEHGIRKIICNRPDGEAHDQAPSEEIAKAAAEAGMGFSYVPLAPGSLTDSLIDEFAEACKADGPVLAYCRSGMRSVTLWALNRVADHTVSDVMLAAHNAGYDLEGVMPMLEARSATG